MFLLLLEMVKWHLKKVKIFYCQNNTAMILLWTREELLGEPDMHWLASHSFREGFKRERTHSHRYIKGPFFLNILTWRFVYWFEREEGGGERERETSVGCLPTLPNWGSNLQSKYVPLLAIELATFGCEGSPSSQRSHQIRACAGQFLTHTFLSLNSGTIFVYFCLFPLVTFVILLHCIFSYKWL